MKILIVEDDAPSREGLAELLRSRNLEVVAVATLAEAGEAAEAQAFDLALLDVQLPDGSGTSLLPKLTERQVDVVMVSGQSTLEDAIEALREGAIDFLTKPLDMARLTAILENLRQRVALRNQVRELRGKLRDLGRFDGMIGGSPAMQRVYECIERVAPTNETVLIMGPSGAGKEVTAATIQRLSRRKDKPYVTVNCGAIPPTLIESELFGHERGAFTGAERRRNGLFEQAHTGTLFLDEITEMSMELQVRLLRVLETGVITRVGGTNEIEVDVRIIAATNRDPEAAVREGKLRHDLLYRLLVFPIHLPPLKDRSGDVELLAEHFLGELAEEYDVERKLTPEALERLRQHGWPGNVRELYNTLRRAYIMAKKDIGAPDLLLSNDYPVDDPAASTPNGVSRVERNGHPGGDDQSNGVAERPGRDHVVIGETAEIHAGMSVAEAERSLIELTLAKTDGNKKEAATMLGISIKTLYSRLQVYAAQDS
ncbi:MAG: sigma-54-dependent Fis family transcriptional regulator [Planctomycetes bacterium]|nr:sigma-54-dependent Fis family transcriptional regulator [Planctomycetota bacterium]